MECPQGKTLAKPPAKLLPERIQNMSLAPERGDIPETQSTLDLGYEVRPSAVVPEEKIESSVTSEAELFDLYEKIAEARPGTRDAEIFERIHEWTFSNFAQSPHAFAGITKEELVAWQTRHRINLSSGHIRPDPIDLERGYAWGHIRLSTHVNHFRAGDGPPSAEEVRQMKRPKAQERLDSPTPV